jgi:hypothetical protein
MEALGGICEDAAMKEVSDTKVSQLYIASINSPSA